jgi:hypothetical protein
MIEEIEGKYVAGKKIDTAEYISLVQAATRLSNTIGINRRAKDITPPSLDEIENEYGSRRNGRVRLIEHEEDDDE